MKKKQVLITVCLGIAACWLGIAIAGNINHSGDPAGGSGMPTLQEVYDYLVDGTAEAPNDTFQEPTGAPGSTGKTTKNIYDDIKTKFDQCTSATPDKVQSGVKFFSTDTAKWGVQTGTMPFAAVPKTGQTAQEAAGDDGDLEKGAVLPTPRFSPNADTTVTDNLTGLIWGPNANLMPTRDGGYDSDGTGGDDGKVFWQTALNYIAKLNTENYLGHTDWRLPTVRELHSLINFKYKGPALTNDAGDDKWGASGTSTFTSVQSGVYWSGTTVADLAGLAWCVNMLNGDVGGVDKTDTWYVWPVRGGQ